VISPAAPRQTVRAVFTHTAFRLPSSGNLMALQGGRTGSGYQRLPRGLHTCKILSDLPIRSERNVFIRDPRFREFFVGIASVPWVE
jgi:hypothetical protein